MRGLFVADASGVWLGRMPKGTGLLSAGRVDRAKQKRPTFR
jgi:hypothetical protein